MSTTKKFTVRYHICDKKNVPLLIVEEQEFTCFAKDATEAETKAIKAEMSTTIRINKTVEV